ncbi:MAG: hypothetical protein AB1346_12980 [Thermodesulfobacteriota bacterium]
MSTTRKVLIGLAVVAALAAAGAYFLVSGLDRIVADAIEKYGSEATGTKVEVGSVRIRLRAGEASIGELRVGNPEGFSASDAIRLGGITVVLDAGSVTEDILVIEKVRIRGPRVSYEIDDTGRSNIDRIRENVGKSRGRENSGGDGTDGNGKKVIIRSLVIEDGEVSIRAAALSGKPRVAAIPAIELKNLGGKGGDSPGAIARQVVGSLANRSAAAAVNTGIGKELEKAAEGARKTLREAGDAVKKIFGR